LFFVDNLEMSTLHARFLSKSPSPEGKQVELALIEPNGDEHRVRCLCRPDGSMDVSEIGDGTMLIYLNDRYGQAHVGGLCREITMQEG
jgi:hypothetical protein